VKKIKRKIKKMVKKPEEILFGFLVFLSLVFAGLCFGQIKNDISAANPAAAAKKAVSPMERKMGKMTSDYPIEKMVPFIARKNKRIAAYLIVIAKKESDWGKYSPKKDGRECYNYWGYRGSYNQTESGYSCFDSPAQAVNVVGRRLGNLVAKKIDTPREMVLWKAGNNRVAARSAGAGKWVRDVSLYYNQLYD
jgi:hypothetical protein